MRGVGLYCGMWANNDYFYECLQNTIDDTVRKIIMGDFKGRIENTNNDAESITRMKGEHTKNRKSIKLSRNNELIIKVSSKPK